MLTFQASLDPIQKSVLVQIAVLDQRIVPESRQHLDEGRLPHTCLPFDDDRDTALSALIDVEHFDGKVQSEDVLVLVNGSQSVVLQGDVQGTGEV